MPKYSIALDIGATKTLAGLVSGNKIIKTIKKTSKSQKTNNEIIKNIKYIINQLWNKNVKKIGIGIAAQVDIKNKSILTTTNFNPKFKNIKLVEILKKEFKVPVLIDNDVKCFVKAENQYGYGRVYDNFVGLTFGTGIGGAIVCNKKLLRGENNLAGEVGHMKISGGWIGAAPACGCGGKYCWETLASGRAWQKIANKYGEKKANKIIIPNIATGLVNLTTILNPEAFVLGGGLIEHAHILKEIRKEFYKQNTQSLLRKTQIVKSKLGDQTILLGSLM
ncbi:MAG: ROK family protein [Patescibacteria group bacterium]